MGYHRTHIAKGKLGEFSKLVEEFAELTDAHDQGVRVLELCELADLLGAIEAYVRPQGLALNDLIAMMELTKSAFESGERKSGESSD